VSVSDGPSLSKAPRNTYDGTRVWQTVQAAIRDAIPATGWRLGPVFYVPWVWGAGPNAGDSIWLSSDMAVKCVRNGIVPVDLEVATTS
jgi:hypothetical protein